MNSSGGLRCFTAPGLVFTTREELQDHYRSDWHRYNLKRKVANMPPIMKVDFEARKAAAVAKAKEQKQSSTAHLKNGKKEKMQKKKEKRHGKLCAVVLIICIVYLPSNNPLAPRKWNHGSSWGTTTCGLKD